MIYMNFIREIRQVMKGILTRQLGDISTTSKKKSKPYELEVNTILLPLGKAFVSRIFSRLREQPRKSAGS